MDELISIAVEERHIELVLSYMKAASTALREHKDKIPDDMVDDVITSVNAFREFESAVEASRGKPEMTCNKDMWMVAAAVAGWVGATYLPSANLNIEEKTAAVLEIVSFMTTVMDAIGLLDEGESHESE